MSTILVVDDSLTVRMDLADAFTAAGFTAVGCASLAEARSALAAHDVGLVILDIMLPDGDGLELLREIRVTRAGTVVLLLSTEAEVKDRIRGLKTGADDYLGKPYDTNYVVARARALLSGDEGGRNVILVVDDSETFRAALRQALEAAGHVVLTAVNGEEGLRIAASARPSAMIVDGVMPGIDGATVIRRLRLDSALRGTPCLLLTGADDRGAELRALDAGADAFVRKGEDLEVILARLAAVLRRPAAESRAVVSARRILAVDDSVTYLEAIGSTLRDEGYDVVLAHSGAEALDLLAAQPVDCILLDLMMPGLDGTETCRRIKASPVVRDIPLVMLTGHEDRAAMIDSLASGADDFIPKSSELEVLKARVRAQLRRKQFEDEHRRIREELLRSELLATEERAARQLAEARAALVDGLERKNRELEAFSYSVSHDLRAPLRAIDGFSLALLEDCAAQLDTTGKSHLERVRAATTRMNRLIEDLLQLSRTGRADLHPRPVDLVAVARAVHDELQERDPSRSVTFLAPPSLVVSADQGLMRVFFDNIVGNAWKFTVKTAAPVIELGVDGDGAYFLRDNGAGFDNAFVGQLFAPFRRLHHEAEYPGTGIGLATVHRIIDRHGGHVWAEGAIGRGATIFFTLPRGSENGGTLV